MEKKNCCPTKFRTSIGGQALIEGILMRGPNKQAIVVRSKDGLVEKVDELKLVRDRCKIFGWPIIRGIITFIDSLIKGVQALLFSADYFPDDDLAKPSKFDLWLEKHFSGETLQKIIVTLSVILSFGMTVVLFLLLPTLLADFVKQFSDAPWLLKLTESVIKFIIFFSYLFLCSKQKDIQRVFQYHGAEHKTIFCYEAGLPLTVENCRTQSRFHPRCGTSFLFVVVVVSIIASLIVANFVDYANIWVRLLTNLALVLPIIGITYEFNRFVGRHDNAFTRFLSKPGLWLQNFTTNEPDDSMLEVAIRALELVRPEEAGKDAW